MINKVVNSADAAVADVKDGATIVEHCTYPLTGSRCVTRICTDLPIIDVATDNLEVTEMCDGLSFDELTRLSGNVRLVLRNSQ